MKKTIAIIEDNEDNRLILKMVLQKDYDVREYSNALEALKKIPGAPPDLILLDITMPEMDGFTFIRRLHAENQLKRPPIIALTAHAMLHDRHACLEAGCDDYITKPIVDEAILLRTIEFWINPQKEARI